MKRLLFAWCLLGVFPVTVLAQEWGQLRSGTTEILTDVHFLDENLGYVSGAFGTILKTTDGGDSWTTLPSPSSESFTAVAVRDEENVLVGRNGLFYSEDEGAKWTEVGGFSQWSSSIFDIDFAPGTGFAYLVKGGQIHRSLDGGTSWGMVYQEEDQWFLDRVHTPEPGVIFLTGGFTRSEFFGFVSFGFVVRSVDEGNSWELLPTQGFSDIMTATWIDRSKGWAFTFTGPVYRTENGGDDWEELATNLDEVGSPLITSSQFVDAEVGYATSFDGKILRTGDGGVTWVVELDLGTGETDGPPLGALQVLSREVVLAVGNDGLIFKRSASGPLAEVRIDGISVVRSKGVVEIVGRASVGQSYRVESSAALQAPWEEVARFTAKEERWAVTTPLEGTAYFRVVSLGKTGKP